MAFIFNLGYGQYTYLGLRIKIYTFERKRNMAILNTLDLSKEFIWQDSLGLVTKYLGKAGGSERLYFNIDTVPPKAYSTKYHSHSQQEEFFLVLSGTGTVRINDKEYPVKAWDFFAKPAGKDIAHTFYNSSGENLVILDVGTVEKEDTCYYPDEDVYMQRSNEKRRIYNGSALDFNWSSEPNGR